MLARALPAAAVIALISIIVAHVATVAYTLSPSLVQGAAFALTDPAMLISTDPFIDFSDRRVMTAALGFAALLVAIALIASVKAQKLNEDTEGAHGDSRMAERDEMGDLMDGRNLCNNILYSEHSGIVRDAWNKKLKDGLYGRNYNCVTLGISGLGKTFNLVMPDLMQSIGDALAPYRCGMRAIIDRVCDRCGIRSYGIENPDRICDSARRKRERAAGVGEGYDVFVTDPKGDCLRDAGRMYEAAGYEVRSMNTVSFQDSCHVNPLAYIDTKTCDVADPEEMETRVHVESGGATWDEAVKVKGSALEISRASGAGFELSVASVCETASDVAEGVTASDEGISALEEKLSGLDPASEEARTVAAQLNMLYAERDTGAGTVTGDAIEQVRSFSYKRTSGSMRIVLANATAAPLTVRLSLAFDRAMYLEGDDSMVEANGSYFEAAFREDDPSIVDILVQLEPKRKGADAPFIWTFSFHVHQQVLPDGAQLTKMVDTLIANLGSGTDAESNGSIDPFWDDTKKLCFMSLISLLFEKYKPEERTIPSMMRLLNMALSPDGNPKATSRLSIIFEEWEHATTFRLEEGAATSAGDGFDWMYEARTTGRKVDTGGIPHPRERSLAVHCYHAFMECADDTVLSVIISCQAALTALVTDEVKELLSEDELGLDELGCGDKKIAIFCVTSDVPSPYDFLTALVVQIAIDKGQSNAYARFGGRLPRHVRFILDEVANIGKIPILVRAIAVVRSRNMSISMYLQSKAQLALAYGEKDADVIFDNCTTWLFLGAQTPDTLDLISNKIGDETVYTRVFNRSFNGSSIAASTSEQLSGTARKVRSGSQLQQMETEKMLVFIYNHIPIEDTKIKTAEHPLYRYINPGQPRKLAQPKAAFDERFDYRAYLQEKRKERERIAA